MLSWGGWRGQESPGRRHPHASRLSAGTLKAVFFVFASLCAWYSGYLLAELVPDMPLSSAVYSIRSIGEKPVLRGGYHSPVSTRALRPSCRGWRGGVALASPRPHQPLMLMMMGGWGGGESPLLCPLFRGRDPSSSPRETPKQTMVSGEKTLQGRLNKSRRWSWE